MAIHCFDARALATLILPLRGGPTIRTLFAAVGLIAGCYETATASSFAERPDPGMRRRRPFQAVLEASKIAGRQTVGLDPWVRGGLTAARVGAGASSDRAPPVVLAVGDAQQGSRSTMEDEYCIEAGGCFGAVFDGHGGGEVARYLRRVLYDQLCAALELPPLGAEGAAVGAAAPPALLQPEGALAAALKRVEADVLAVRPWRRQGATVAVVLVVEEGGAPGTGAQQGGNGAGAAGAELGDGPANDPAVGAGSSGNSDGDSGDGDSGARQRQRYAVTAHAGDARAVLGRCDGSALELTQDHKPEVWQRNAWGTHRGASMYAPGKHALPAPTFFSLFWGV